MTQPSEATPPSLPQAGALRSAREIANQIADDVLKQPHINFVSTIAIEKIIQTALDNAYAAGAERMREDIQRIDAALVKLQELIICKENEDARTLLRAMRGAIDNLLKPAIRKLPTEQAVQQVEPAGEK